MGRVLTNNVGMSYTIESALGVAGTVWFLLEPNAISTFGADITTVARDPISANRQRRKGTVTDLDSAVEFDADITLSSFRDFIEGFCFATGVNTDVTQLATTAADTTLDDYTVSALSAAQADKMEVGTLIHVTGFLDAANNGIKVVDADIASSATLISVVENLVTETAPADAKLSLCGHEIATADVVTWTWAAGAKEATLNLTGIVAELQALGLTVGQFVHVGSGAVGSVAQAFENAAANDMFGYARVKSFTGADDVIFDKVDAALQFTDGTDPTTAVHLLFGEFIRNVATTASDFLERSFQFEAEWDNLDTGGNNEYSYAKGNFCNSVSFNLPLAEKATVTFGFIGTDTEDPVVSGSRKTGASAATSPTKTTAFNTSADIVNLRITEVDETGLSTDFKSVSLTLNNNVSPEKVLGTLGAKFMNTGNFEVDIEAQLLFTDGLVVDRIRANTTLTMDFLIKNDDGAIAVDLPALTLGGGGLEFPVNESVLINTTSNAFQDPTLGTSIGISIFPVVPV